MRRIRIVRVSLIGLFVAVCAVIASDQAKAEVRKPTPEFHLSWIENGYLLRGREAAEWNRCEELKYHIGKLERRYSEEQIREDYRTAGVPLRRQDREKIVNTARAAITELKGLLKKIDCSKPPPAKEEWLTYVHLGNEGYYRILNAQESNDCVGFYKALAAYEQFIATIPPKVDQEYKLHNFETLSQATKQIIDQFAAEGCPKKEIQQAKSPPQQQVPVKKGEPRITSPKGAPPVATPGLIVNTGLDGGQWCTYGSGIGFPTFAPPTDDNGTPLFPGGTFINDPPTWPLPVTVSPPWGGDITITDLPSGPTIIDTPFGPRIVTRPPPGSVPPPSSPPETPVAGPPSQPPTDKPPEQTPPTIVFPPITAPPETPIIIFVKATQSVLEGQPQGTGLPGYNTALFAPKPELPFIDDGTQTTQQDAGFDQDPVKCTTGQGGECQLNLSLGALKDIGAAMGFDTGSNPPSHFRIDYSVPQTTGGVLEITGLGGNDVINIDTLRSGLPDQVNIFPDTFNIGDRSFLRLGFDQPFGLDFDFGSHVTTQLSDTKLFGRPVIYIIDFCRDKQPGPPLGAQPVSFSSMDQALPASTVKLRLSILDRLRASPRVVGLMP